MCVATHIADTSQNSQTCNTTSDVAGDCRAPGCETGVCVATHIADTSQNSQSCNTTTDIPGDCFNPGCENGVCVATHIPDPTEGGGTARCANPALGAATGCTVFELDGGTITMMGPIGPVEGNVCVGNENNKPGKLTMTGGTFIDGDVELAPGATCTGCTGRVSGTVMTDVNLSSEIAAVVAAAQANQLVSQGGRYRPVPRRSGR